MSKVDLNFKVKGLDGKEIENTNAGEILASHLVMGRSDVDALKLYEIALKFHEGKPVDLDTTDKERVLGIIRESKELSNLLKAQLELAFR